MTARRAVVKIKQRGDEAPESLSEWNREYGRLKIGEAEGCLPLDDKDG